MSQETRKDPRAKIVSLNVRYKSATVDEFIENHSHDVSKGGIFIKTATPFAPGTLLKFEIRLAGDQAVIAGVGRVVWKREGAQTGGERPVGMGVKFIKLDESSRTVIDRLIGINPNAGSAFLSEPSADLTAVASASSPSKGPPSSSAAPPRPVAGSRSPAAGQHKQTIVGLGAGGGAKPSNPPVIASPAAAAASSNAAGGGSAFFPKTNSEQEMPAPQERTVMRQAAELLEEALIGAGGSIDEIGANPTFGAGPAAGRPAEASPATLATPGNGRQGHEVEQPGVPTKREGSTRSELAGGVGAVLSNAGAAATLAPPVEPEGPRTKRSIPPMSAQALVQPTPEKSSMAWLGSIGVLVVLGAGVFVLYQKHLIGPKPEPPLPPPTEAPAMIAPAPTLTESAAPPSVSASAAPTASASAAPPAVSASASARTADAGVAIVRPALAVKNPAPVAAPKPAAPKPAPKPTATEATPDHGAEPASTASSAPAATATTAPTAPKPKGPKADDDNPY